MSPAKENTPAIASDVLFGSMREDQTGGRRVDAPDPVTLTLDERGTIHDCSQSGKQLFGYLRSELIWQHVSKLFPQLSDVALVENSRLNPRLGFLCHCGHQFLAQGSQGNTFFSKLNFIHLDNAEKEVLKLIVRPAASAESR